MTDYQNSELYYLKGIAVDSSYWYTHENLSNLYRCTGRYIEAEQSRRQVIRLHPEGAGAYYFLASICSMLQRVDEADFNLEAERQREHLPYELIDGQSQLGFLKSHTGLWNTILEKYFPNKIKNY